MRLAGALGALLCVSALGCGSSQSPRAADNPSGGTGGKPTGGTGGKPAGGTGGGGGSEPVILPPVACEGLAAKVGVWEDITPPVLRTPANVETYSVVVSPKDGTLFVTGGNQTNGGACPAGTDCPVARSGVQRSSDCGASFMRVNSDTGDSANLMTGALWAMVMHPTRPEIMYVANGYGDNPTLYKSTDAGATWSALSPDPAGDLTFIQAIAIDPDDGNHLALTWHENCPAPHSLWCFSRTTDGGQTWALFEGPTSIPDWDIPGWMEGSAITILGKTSYIVSSPAGIWFTADTGATWKQVAPEIVYVGYAGATTIAGGNLFVAGAGHVLFSPAQPDSDPPYAVTTTGKLEVLPNSPLITALITDGETVFAGNARNDRRPLWTTPVANPGGWSQASQEICRGDVCRGPNNFAYDPVHNVVYAANWGTGLWRYVIK
ncbi:MAG TPA: hypothetical protein VJN18_11965 [Polyangiaceae bacterium]|nr:hypothetical protein [Polyangiaceae bacterium]